MPALHDLGEGKQEWLTPTRWHMRPESAEKLDGGLLRQWPCEVLLKLVGSELPSGVVNENEATCQMHMQRQTESCMNTLHSLQLFTPRWTSEGLHTEQTMFKMWYVHPVSRLCGYLILWQWCYYKHVKVSAWGPHAAHMNIFAAQPI